MEGAGIHHRAGGWGRARRSRSGPARPELSPTFPRFKEKKVVSCKITQCMMNGGEGGETVTGGRMGEREAREQRSEEEEVMKEGNRPSLGATA